MNSDAPFESTVRTSLIPLHGRKSWGQLRSLLLKIEGGGGNSCPPFCLEAYIFHLAKGLMIFGQGYALKP